MNEILNSDDARHIQDHEAEAHREAIRVEAALTIANQGLRRLLFNYGRSEVTEEGPGREHFRAETVAWLMANQFDRTAKALGEYNQWTDPEVYDIDEHKNDVVPTAFARLAQVFFTEQIEQADTDLTQALNSMRVDAQ
jgi:hypothetical protein